MAEITLIAETKNKESCRAAARLVERRRLLESDRMTKFVERGVRILGGQTAVDERDKAVLNHDRIRLALRGNILA